jgi:tetratricopeptide (TPR) repeat protein
VQATAGRALLAAFLIATACGSRDERIAERVSRAESLVAEERIEDALIELQGALKIDPQSAAVNQRMAELLRDQGAQQRAFHHFGEAYQLDPTRIDAALAQAELLRSGAPQRAARIVARLKRSHPDDARVRRAESAAALARGDPERARVAALEALALGRDDRESWLQLASVHRARARAARETGAPPDEALEAALDAYAELEKLGGGDATARLGRARVYASWPGHAEDALRAFRGALAMTTERGDDEGRRRAGIALERYARGIGDVALRREALRHQTAAVPRRLGAWERLAAVTEILDGEEAALEVYRELISAWPESRAAHISYSSHLARGNRIDAALRHLEGTIDAGLDDPLLHEQLVRLELARGRFDIAQKHAATLRQLGSAEPVAVRADARIALAEHRLDAAADLLIELTGPRASAESEALRAQVELARGRVDEAIAAAGRAVALAPGFSAPAQRLVAHVHAAAADWATAHAALDELERHGVTLSPSERLIRARADYASGDAGAGRTGLLELLEGAEAPPGAAVEFARREGPTQPDAARVHLERALTRAPSNGELLDAITRLEIRQGGSSRALERLDRAVAAGDANPRLLLLRAELHAGAGRLGAAEADALRALEAASDLPEAAADLLLAIYRARGTLEEARQSFEEAEEAGVLHTGARLLLARLQVAAGDAGRARETYERVLEQRPDLATAKNDLAFLLASRGEQLERALGLAEAARLALPGSANAADTVGYVQLRLGRADLALAHFRTALALAGPDDPSLATLHYHQGLALEALGRGAEATAQLEQALRLDAGFPAARDARQRLAASQAIEIKTESN